MNPARMPIHRSIETIDSMARKNKMKVSISVPGEKEVVLSDHRDDASDAQVLLDLENLTKTNVDNLTKINAEIKKITEMIQSTLMNDEAYRKAQDDLKVMTKERNRMKLQIMQQSGNKQLADKLKDLKIEKKELAGAQSDYLREYQRMSGSTQLELFDGTVGEIVAMYKLIKPKKG